MSLEGPIELGDPDRGICCVCSAGGAVAGCGSSPGSVLRPENGTVTHPATDNSARTGKVVGALVLMVVFVVAMGYFTVWRRRGTARMQFGTRNHYDEKVELLDVLWDSGESDSEEVCVHPAIVGRRPCTPALHPTNRMLAGRNTNPKPACLG